MRNLLFALLLTLTASAAAQQRREEAAVHVDRGTALFNSGAFKSALVEFEAAHRLSSAWEVLIHIGVTQARLSQHVAALETLRRYLREGGAKVPAGMRARVENETRRIRALLAVVEIVVEGADGAATIEIDGREVGKSPLKGHLLEPRAHTLSAQRAGFDRAKQKLELAPGEQRRVVLRLVRSTGILRIESRPTGARISLDGKKVGRAPWEQRVVVGKHTIAGQLDDHEPASAKVMLEAGQTRQVTLELNATPVPARPWYKKWYWWTAIGVGVAAGVVGVVGVVVATRPHYDIAYHLPGDYE